MPWSQKLYSSRRWNRLSKLWLRIHPICAQCERQGKTEIAVLTHHVEPQREGDHETKFWAGPYEGLCRDCHEAQHGRPVALPYRKDIGLDGQPLDPEHPYWEAERRQQQEHERWDSANRKLKRSST